MNDFWSYSIASNTWSQISDNRVAVYGPIGEASTDYYPGRRQSSISWLDEQNNTLYLFGGLASGTYIY